MFDLCAIIGFDIDKKPNLDIVLKNEYDAEILDIYPQNLKKSPLITGSISSCFPNKKPSIFSQDKKLLYPNSRINIDCNLQSKIHQFSVTLDDQSQKHCYVLSFYEQAYIQQIETLAGNAAKIITWSPTLDITSLIQSKQQTGIKTTLFQNNTNIKIFVQKSIVIVTNLSETGCEGTLINFINQQLSKDDNRSNYLNKQYIQNSSNQKGMKFLNELLAINSELLLLQKLQKFEMKQLFEFFNLQHQPQKQLLVSNLDFEENSVVNSLPILKSETIWEQSETLANNMNKIVEEMYMLQEMPKDIFNNPPDKIKLYRERVRKSNKKAKKPLVPIQPLVYGTKQIQFSRTMKNISNIRPQEFSFHDSSEKKSLRNQIFNKLDFPQKKKLFQL